MPSASLSALRYRNQVEPDAVVDAFRAYPPLDFEVLAEPPNSAPAFAMRFDLLTTVDPDDQAALQRYPLYRLWSRWLKLRTAFIGTTVSEFMLAPRDTPPQDWLARLNADWSRRFPLTILKDIPRTTPLLSDQDNAYNKQLIDACQQAGFLIVEGQALAWVPIEGDEASYLAELSSGRRRDIRRKLRARERLRVRVVHSGDPLFNETDCLAELYGLYRQVYDQSEVHFDLLSADFFTALLQNRALDARVFLYDDLSGRLIGFNLCLVENNVLVDKYIGLSYPAAREHNLYYVSWFENLKYARQNSLSKYIAGWTDPEIKAYLGAQFSMTCHAVWVRNPLMRFILRRLSSKFESDHQWYQAHKSPSSSDTP